MCSEGAYKTLLDSLSDFVSCDSPNLLWWGGTYLSPYLGRLGKMPKALCEN